MSQFDDGENRAVFEFHIAARTRHKLGVDDTLFATDERMIFTDFHGVRELAFRMNADRAPHLHIFPGELNAAGLLDEVFHILLREYERQIDPELFRRARQWLGEALGHGKLQRILLDFVLEFPPLEVYRGKTTATGWLGSNTGGRDNSAIAVEELMLVLLANQNPATEKFRDLFNREYLENQAALDELMASLEGFFAVQPPMRPHEPDLLTMLKLPMLAAPHDLNAQLDYVIEHWKSILGEEWVVRLLKGKDLMKEDVRAHIPTDPGAAFVPFYKDKQAAERAFIGKSGFDFAGESIKDYEAHEAFTEDSHWMPQVVLMAKNIRVWLDQLSKKYQRDISRLDRIPDEELDRLARWNFNGLWLIGIWERSTASRRIKHIMGFTDAVSSAYSLYDYVIAHDLGGEEAYRDLDHRARARGIRLASDMVPNHTGIYSKWVIQHPDYFIQTAVPPFPAYRFTGENLSEHPDIEIRIEDGYYSKTDAAVVFQRIDRRTDDVRYLYHGNDGTNMPWNDTAQLDMLKEEVREAVIRQIFDVAGRFSIIRFDAAMTLAKKHFARLWYPRPGSGGDIPSRIDHAMSQEQFDAFFPVEFWREVMDRMNEAMPETLLLAEAFWLMEGYFVRTLGMHRVYNSAFMHMLRNEENKKYRELIINTLEFDPEILKRYVNFMSNPDEETAISQFGTGDKYFGICVLMSTLPGLPMFAHGQLEGYTEKYGMEYQRAYYNELPLEWLLEKHRQEIFPLLKKRFLFAGVEHFQFYDFVDDAGPVNENVMAYSNRYGQEQALVLYNNKYEKASGRISKSVPRLSKEEGGGLIPGSSLAEALNLDGGRGFYYVFKEHISGLEYLIGGQEILEQGLYRELNGFEYRVFWEFREIHDALGIYDRLCHSLAGKGVPNIEQARKELELEQVYAAFESLFRADVLEPFIEALRMPGAVKEKAGMPEPFVSHYRAFEAEVAAHYGLEPGEGAAARAFSDNLQRVVAAYGFVKDHESELIEKVRGRKTAGSVLLPGARGPLRESAILFAAFFAKKSLESLAADREKVQVVQQALMLHWPLKNVLKSTGRSPGEIERDIELLDLLLLYGTALFDLRERLPQEPKTQEALPEALKEKFELMGKMLEDPGLRKYIGVNFFKGCWYFSKEQFEELLVWLFSAAVFEYFARDRGGALIISEDEIISLVGSGVFLLDKLMEFSEQAGYRLEMLVNKLRSFEQ